MYNVHRASAGNSSHRFLTCIINVHRTSAGDSSHRFLTCITCIEYLLGTLLTGFLHVASQVILTMRNTTLFVMVKIWKAKLIM